MLSRLINFQFHSFIKSNRYIIPLIAFAVYMAVSYWLMPVAVLDSYVLSAIALFFVACFTGFSFNDTENEVVEQIVFFKVEKKSLIYWSKLLFLMLFCAVISGAAVFLPAAANLFLPLFSRPLTVADIVLAVAIHLLFSASGVLSGLLLNRRIISDRKKALLIIVTVAVMALVKGPLANWLPVFYAVTWIFPPIYDMAGAIVKDDVIHLTPLLLPAGWMLLYILAQACIYQFLMRRNLF